MSTSQEQMRDTAINVFKSVILPKMDAKGKQYAPDNAYANFESGAAMSGLTQEAFLISLATKHWVWLCVWASGQRPDASKEELLDRMADIIIYLFILWSMESNSELESPEE